MRERLFYIDDSRKIASFIILDNTRKYLLCYPDLIFTLKFFKPHLFRSKNIHFNSYACKAFYSDCSEHSGIETFPSLSFDRKSRVSKWIKNENKFVFITKESCFKRI